MCYYLHLVLELEKLPHGMEQDTEYKIQDTLFPARSI